VVETPSDLRYIALDSGPGERRGVKPTICRLNSIVATNLRSLGGGTSDAAVAKSLCPLDTVTFVRLSDVNSIFHSFIGNKRE